MDNGSADIIAGIKELRAKVEAQLTGNDYYMIALQLDALAASTETANAAAKSLLNSIESRLNGADPGPAAAASGDAATSASAEGPHDGDQVVAAPTAGSFGGPQATVAVSFTAVEPPAETESAADGAEISSAEAAPVDEASAAATGLWAAVDAVRAFAEERLGGNDYYTAANLLAQLRSFPPSVGRSEAIPAPASGDEALAVLRGEIIWLSGFAQVEAARLIAALAHVMAPKAAPAPQPATAAEPDARLSPDLADAPDPEPEARPRVGFDDLADAAWQRVKTVAQADSRPAHGLNGSAAPSFPMPKPAPAQPAAKAAPHVEPMAQDMGEALDDGGSERRSSEPCYAGEFELAAARPAAHGDHESAGQTASEQEAEAAGEASPSAEADILTEPADHEAPVAAGPGIKTAESEEATAAVVIEQAAIEVPIAVEEPAPQPSADAVAGEPTLAEAAEDAAAGVSSVEAGSGEAAEEEPKRETARSQPARRGLFSRLFGGRPVERR